MLSAGSQPEACILNMKHILDAFAVHYLFNVSTFVSTFSYNLPVTGMIKSGVRRGPSRLIFSPYKSL